MIKNPFRLTDSHSTHLLTDLTKAMYDTSLFHEARSLIAFSLLNGPLTTSCMYIMYLDASPRAG
jgi:hypothetical protein